LCTFADNEIAYSTDSHHSSCEAVESDDQSVLWDSDWYAPDEEGDVEHEDVTHGELSAEENENVADGTGESAGESDDSRESVTHRWWSAETVTFGADEIFEWHVDASGELLTASDNDSGADELM